MIDKLREEMLRIQGYTRTVHASARIPGLLPIETVFPNRVFPLASVHEFSSSTAAECSATCGFLSGILDHILQKKGICVWVGRFRKTFPPALAQFGHQPESFIFIDTDRDKQVLWVVEEALKCASVHAVVGEVEQINFVQSRRLQLAAEKKGITAFLLNRNSERTAGSVCAARWRISPVSGEIVENMPGVGFPRWNVELLKVRNGDTGSWKVTWQGDHFTTARRTALRVQEITERKTG
ncbi:MAG: Error-prone repair protein ImuA [Mucilaginibacter polytrichastri]|nr:Error-prone repair protein ImuA [Mucilaginibacter polytrichastri]